MGDVEAGDAMQTGCSAFKVCRSEYLPPAQHSHLYYLIHFIGHRPQLRSCSRQTCDSHFLVLQQNLPASRRACELSNPTAQAFQTVSNLPGEPSFSIFSHPHTWHANPPFGLVGPHGASRSPVEALRCSGAGMHASGLGSSRSEARNSNPPRSELASSGTGHDASCRKSNASVWT